MASVTLGVRMDEDLKRKMDEVAGAIGITTAAAVNVFARQFVVHRGFPFEVKEPVPTKEEFEAEIERIMAEMDAGHYTVHELIEA